MRLNERFILGLQWGWYTFLVQRHPWARLAVAFPPSALVWRVTDVSDESTRARVRPQLAAEDVRRRLDDVLGREGWSVTFQAFPDGSVGCALTLRLPSVESTDQTPARPESDLAVTRSVVVSPGPVVADAETLSNDALARAAEQFGLLPAVDPTGTYWVDYDAEAKEILHPPEVPATPAVAAVITPPAGGGTPAKSGQADATKPAVQQVVDRLVERLRAEGLGLQAAKLLVAYGGYGHDAATARELYAKLRALLVEREAPTA